MMLKIKRPRPNRPFKSTSFFGNSSNMYLNRAGARLCQVVYSRSVVLQQLDEKTLGHIVGKMRD